MWASSSSSAGSAVVSCFQGRYSVFVEAPYTPTEEVEWKQAFGAVGPPGLASFLCSPPGPGPVPLQTAKSDLGESPQPRGLVCYELWKRVVRYLIARDAAGDLRIGGWASRVAALHGQKC